MSDVFEVLEADHREVEAMLRRLEARSSNQIAQKLVMEQSRHETAEEMHLWPAVREHVAGGDELADEALVQEREAKTVLDQLRKSKPGDDDFRRLVDSFAAAAREHIAFEEDRVWPKLRVALSPGQREELGTKVQAAKKTGPTRPHPGGPDSPGCLRFVGPATAVMDRIRDLSTGRR